MENSDLNSQENLKKEVSFIEQQAPVSQNETNFNQSFTNEQKLEYLSKLIQDLEKKLEFNTRFLKP